MHLLLRLDHLRGPLAAQGARQPLGIVLAVEDSNGHVAVGAAALPVLVRLLQVVAELREEMRVLVESSIGKVIA